MGHFVWRDAPCMSYTTAASRKSLHRVKHSNMYWIGSVLILALITIPPGSFGNLAAKRYESTCDTNPTDIHLTKDEYDGSTGLLIRTCEENVAVNKCEGQCASSIYPSALNAYGFQKECHCCRESRYRERSITLGSCYDSDGNRLTGSLATMKVTINEPMDCKCLECGH